MLRTVPEEDVKALRAKRARKMAEVVIGRENGLPTSLSGALISFCLSGAIRSLRSELAGKSHTMLVHVSQRTDDQERIAAAIREQVELRREAERQGQRLDELFASYGNRSRSASKLLQTTRLLSEPPSPFSASS